jgi:hypothetical protein
VIRVDADLDRGLDAVLVMGHLVIVRRDDLEYLLAHVADEVYGTPRPDRSHWQLPLLNEAIARLTGALAAPESSNPGGC